MLAQPESSSLAPRARGLQPPGRTSRVCWPSRGAGFWTRIGFSKNLSVGPHMVMVPAPGCSPGGRPHLNTSLNGHHCSHHAPRLLRSV